MEERAIRPPRPTPVLALRFLSLITLLLTLVFGMLLSTSTIARADEQEMDAINEKALQTLAVTGKRVTQVALSRSHGAAVTSDGSLYTWGYNEHGQLGQTIVGSYQQTPSKVSLTDVKAVAVSDDNSAAITSKGELYTWGENGYHQLGYDTTDSKFNPTPKKVSGISDVSAVAISTQHCAALTSNGDLYTWGNNSNGVLGYDATGYQSGIVPTPKQVPELSNITAIDVDDTHSAAITSSGDLYIWGSNYQGQLGDDTRSYRSTPKIVSGLPKVKAVSLGASSTAVITLDGSLYTWGDNDYGQLGDSTKTDRKVPKVVSGLSNVSAVDIDYHCMAIISNGNLSTWGNNNSGELGDGTSTPKLVPQKISTLSNVTAIAAGPISSAAVTSDGSLWTWGSYVNGVLGNGDYTSGVTANVYVPSQIIQGSGLSPTQQQSSVIPSTSALTLEVGGQSKTVTVSGTGDGALTAVSSDDYVVSVSGSGTSFTIKPVGVGRATVTISRAGTDRYLPSSAKVIVAVNKQKSSVVLSPASLTLEAGGQPQKVTISGIGDGALSVSPASTTAASASISGNTLTVTPKAQGTASFTVNRAATNTYDASSAKLDVTVNAKKQSTITPEKESLELEVGGPDGELSASLVGTGAFSATSLNEQVATARVVSSSTGSSAKIAVHPVGAGTTTIRLALADNDSYVGTTKDIQVTVKDKAELSASPTSITFNRPAQNTYSPANSTVTLTYKNCTVSAPSVPGITISKVSDSNGRATFRITPTSYVSQDTTQALTFTGRVSGSTTTVTTKVDVTLKGYTAQGGSLLNHPDDWYNFINSSSDFGNPQNYVLDGEYYDLLMSYLKDSSYRESIKNDCMLTGWGGSCYGMAVTLAHFKQGALDEEFFQPGVKSPRSFSAPSVNKGLKNLINYYHLLQAIPIYSNATGYWNYNEPEVNRALIQQLKEAKCPVLFCISITCEKGHGSGHALLAYDYQKSGSNYIVSVWDPNHKDLINGKPLTLTISEDGSMSEFQSGYEWNSVTYCSGCRKMNKHSNAIVASTRLDGNKLASFMNCEAGLKQMGMSSGYMRAMATNSIDLENTLVTNYANFDIIRSDGVGAHIENGRKVSGELDITDGRFMNEPSEPTKVSFILPDLSTGQDYTVVPQSELPESGEFTTGALLSGSYSHAVMASGGSIKIESDGSISSQLDSRAQQTISVTLDDTQTSWSSVTVSGTSAQFALTAAGGATTIETDTQTTVDVTVSEDQNSTTVQGTGSEFTVEESGDRQVELTADGATVDSATLGHSAVFYTGGADPIDTQTDIAPGGQVVRPADPVLEGKRFEGWYTSPQGGSEYDFSTPVYENLTLYAHWADDGGSGSDDPNPDNPEGDTVEMLRLYNPWSGEHLFTNDRNEYRELGEQGWRQEDLAWISPAESSVPVYRLYNPYSGDHHYTTDKGEYDTMISWGWSGEGPAFYSADSDQGVPIYRLYNPYVQVGTHHYTMDWEEYRTLPDLGWMQEDIGWYGLMP